MNGINSQVIKSRHILTTEYACYIEYSYSRYICEKLLKELRLVLDREILYFKLKEYNYPSAFLKSFIVKMDKNSYIDINNILYYISCIESLCHKLKVLSIYNKTNKLHNKLEKIKYSHLLDKS